MSDIKTINGEIFSHEKSCELAYLIYERFGKDLDSAHSAWRRLLQNNCSKNQYNDLIKSFI